MKSIIKRLYQNDKKHLSLPMWRYEEMDEGNKVFLLADSNYVMRLVSYMAFVVGPRTKTDDDGIGATTVVSILPSKDIVQLKYILNTRLNLKNIIQSRMHIEFDSVSKSGSVWIILDDETTNPTSWAFMIPKADILTIPRHRQKTTQYLSNGAPVIWYTQDNVEIFRRNVLVDLVECGVLLESRKLSSMDYILAYGSHSVVRDLLDRKVLVGCAFDGPTTIHRLPYSEERLTPLLAAYYKRLNDRLLQQTTMTQKLIRDARFVGMREANRTELGEVYVQWVNDTLRALHAYEISGFSLTQARSHLAKAPMIPVEGMMPGGPKVDVVSRLIIKLLATRGGGAHVVVLPRVDLRPLIPHIGAMPNIFVMYAGTPASELLNISLNVMIPTVILMDERTLLQRVPSCFEWMRQHVRSIHAFNYRVMYSPSMRRFMHSLLSPRQLEPTGLHIYVFDNNVEFVAASVLYARKQQHLRRMETTPEQWLSASVVFDMPLLRVDPLMEEPFDSRSIYDIVELTPMEVYKLVGLAAGVDTVRVQSPFITEDVSINNSIRVKLRGPWLNSFSEVYVWALTFLRNELRVTRDDVTGISLLLARGAKDLELVLTEILMSVFTQHVRVPLPNQTISRLMLWSADNIPGLEIQNILMFQYPNFESRLNVSAEFTEDEIVTRYFVHPRILMFFCLLAPQMNVAWKRLLWWRRLFGRNGRMIDRWVDDLLRHRQQWVSNTPPERTRVETAEKLTLQDEQKIVWV